VNAGAHGPSSITGPSDARGVVLACGKGGVRMCVGRRLFLKPFRSFSGAGLGRGVNAGAHGPSSITGPSEARGVVLRLACGPGGMRRGIVTGGRRFDS